MNEMHEALRNRKKSLTITIDPDNTEEPVMIMDESQPEEMAEEPSLELEMSPEEMPMDEPKDETRKGLAPDNEQVKEDSKQKLASKDSMLNDSDMEQFMDESKPSQPIGKPRSLGERVMKENKRG